MKLTDYAGDAGPATGLSQRIWYDFDLTKLVTGPDELYGVMHYFTAVPYSASSAIAYAPWYCYLDTGDTINGSAVAGGGVVLTTAATDNNAPVLGYGHPLATNASAPFKVLTSTGKDLAFEALVKVSSAALSEAAYFVGLGTPARAINDGLMVDNPDGTVALTMSDYGYIGFVCPAAAAPVWYPAYVKAGGTDSAGSTTTAVALDTWIKLGFRFDVTDDTLKWFVNGVQVRSIDVGDAGSTNFPSGVLLTPYLALKNSAGTAKSLTCRWVGCVQKF